MRRWIRSLFHPEVERGRAYEAQVAAAKGVCAVCPVRAECLAFA
ncbi:MAG: WhiB family transcriptional regulator, partial [Dehalococcoidia bacterium]